MNIRTISTSLSSIPLLRHRDTVNPNIQADKDDFVIKYEATNDHLANTTVAEINTMVEEINNTVDDMILAVDEVEANAMIAQSIGNYQGAWNSTTAYLKNQSVSIGNLFYTAKANNTNISPSNTDYWLNNPINNKLNTNISTYDEKTTPINADLIPLCDSADAFAIKKLSWANLKTTLANLFVSRITTPTANALVKVNADGSIDDTSIIVDDNGNVGVGVVPSDWEYNTLQINGCHISSNGLAHSEIGMNTGYSGGNDVYLDGANSAVKYIQRYDGAHLWQAAPSGPAGNPITWTTAMTLDASGTLTIDTANTVNYFAIKASGADKIYLTGGASYGAFTTGDCGIGAASGYSLKFGSNNTIKMNLDTSGNLLLTSGTGGLGYGTGAGGTVTQLASKSTAVTLNKPTGRIIMNNAPLAPGTVVDFAVNNSTFGSFDTVKLTGKAWSGRYRIEDVNSSTGSFSIRVTNTSGISQSDPIEIDFTIFKGANA